jgi:hypothetical protein
MRNPDHLVILLSDATYRAYRWLNAPVTHYTADVAGIGPETRKRWCWWF